MDSRAAVPVAWICSTWFALVGIANVQAQTWTPSKAAEAVRIATFNVSLNRSQPGQLQTDLVAGNEQAWAIASVIRAVQPDVLLLNEVDYQADVDNAGTFAKLYLEKADRDLLGSEAWSMPHRFAAPVNTGIDSGLDLNANQRLGEPEDAWGYGRFPGQYGMAVLSRYPVADLPVRTFQEFRWSQLPHALRPQVAGEAPYYPDSVWRRLRLASKSFWDVPLHTPHGNLHVLASHPTPPAFDGPEDRNGCRNHDEVALLQAYIENASFLVDDRGQAGGLQPEEAFVILGDLNTDPQDGGSRGSAIRRLLEHPRVAQFAAPASRGGALASAQQGGANARHVGKAEHDTADFNDRSVGNLRVDYVLPSQDWEVVASGVFWPDVEPLPSDQRQALRQVLDASDHRLVWVDVRRGR